MVVAGAAPAAAQPAWQVQHLAKQRIPRAAYGCVREVKGSDGVLIALTNPHYRRAALKVLRETGTQGWVVTVPARLSEPGLRALAREIRSDFGAPISWAFPNPPTALSHPSCGPIALSYDARHAPKQVVDRLRSYSRRYGEDRVILDPLVGL